MKNIIFGFSRPKKWKPFAAAIMAVDDINFDHGYTKFRSDRWEADFIYQSSGTRTNFMGGDYFRKLNTVIEEYVLQVPDEVEAKVGHLCVTREGAPYPVKSIIGIGVVKFFGLVGAKIKNPWPSEFRDCVGEQAAILSGGLGIYCPLDFNEMTPKEFRNWLLTVPGLTKVEVAA